MRTFVIRRVGCSTDADFYARAALEYGLRTAGMEAQWARWAIAKIEERHGAGVD